MARRATPPKAEPPAKAAKPLDDLTATDLVARPRRGVRAITEHDTGLGANLYFETALRRGETLAAAAYRAVRGRHPFLTDDNHTWKAVPRRGGCFAITIYRTTSAPEPMCLGGPLPSWVPRGPGSFWCESAFYPGPMQPFLDRDAAALRRSLAERAALDAARRRAKARRTARARSSARPR